MPVQISIDVGEVRKGIANMAKAHLWGPLIINRTMTRLGKEGAEAMKEALRDNKYRGILEGSVNSSYNPSTKELFIGPNAKRGTHDAGQILENGTVPIRSLPWKPIRDWSFARGLNLKQARGVWLKIRERGVSPHPFVERTVQSFRFQAALLKASDSIARDMAAEVFKGDRAG